MGKQLLSRKEMMVVVLRVREGLRPTWRHERLMATAVTIPHTMMLGTDNCIMLVQVHQAQVPAQVHAKSPEARLDMKNSEFKTVTLLTP